MTYSGKGRDEVENVLIPSFTDIFLNVNPNLPKEK